MVVVGAGVIGLELGSVWSRLGSRVTALEYMDSIAAGADEETASNLKAILKAQGMDFKLGYKVTSAVRKENGNSGGSDPESRRLFSGGVGDGCGAGVRRACSLHGGTWFGAGGCADG